MTRIRLTVATLTAVGAALLVGCGDAETGTSSTSASVSSTPTPTETTVEPADSDPLLVALRRAADTNSSIDLSFVVDRGRVREYAIADAVWPEVSTREMALLHSDGTSVYVLRVPETLLSGCAEPSASAMALCGRAQVRRFTEGERAAVPEHVRPPIGDDAFVLTAVD